MSDERDKVIINIESLVGRFADGARLIPTIYRVHDRAHRAANAECYEPEIVSIGPIHHGKDNVKGMEQHKVAYLSQLLRRRRDLTVDDYVRKLRTLEEKARQCYEPPVPLGQDEFLTMMLLDGCFVIELMRKYWFGDLRDKNDPIFHYEHVLNQLRNDVMLFENQLPLFVLDHLFEMTKTGDPEDNIRSLVLFFVERLFSSEKEYVLGSGKPDGAHHLLGLVYESRYSGVHVGGIERGFRPTEKTAKLKQLTHINTASELKQVGIKFKASNEKTLLDVIFSDGVLHLPPLRVSDHTEPFLRNLIAYEQQLPCDRHKRVTEYAFFMHCLVNTNRDVRILRGSGTITNWLGDDKAVRLMFNGLGENVVRFPEPHYSDVFERVDGFCRARRNKWMAALMQKHCSSPWTMVSVVAGGMLLVLTLTQTVFSVLSFALKHP